MEIVLYKETANSVIRGIKTLIESIASNPGTYALILQVENAVNIQVGQLAKQEFLPGFYLYCGSARGPGGVRARVDRHLRKRKKSHWHIDYLTSGTHGVGASIHTIDIWYSYADFWNECRWAETVIAWSGRQTANVGFGSSDCRCQTHLVYFHSQPDISEFKRRVSVSGVKKRTVEEISSTLSASSGAEAMQDSES